MKETGKFPLIKCILDQEVKISLLQSLDGAYILPIITKITKMYELPTIT